MLCLHAKFYLAVRRFAWSLPERCAIDVYWSVQSAHLSVSRCKQLPRPCRLNIKYPCGEQGTIDLLVISALLFRDISLFPCFVISPIRHQLAFCCTVRWVVVSFFLFLLTKFWKYWQMSFKIWLLWLQWWIGYFMFNCQNTIREYSR